MRKQVEALKDDADAGADLPHQLASSAALSGASRGAAHLDAPERDGAFLESLQPVQAAEHRRLAAAGRPEDGRELRLGDGERRAVQDRRRTVALDDVGDRDHPGAPRREHTRKPSRAADTRSVTAGTAPRVVTAGGDWHAGPR